MVWVFDFDDLKFEANIIVLKYNTSEIRIPLNEIWSLLYVKWSLKNGFSLMGTSCITMGCLYIATKKMTKFSEVIKIRVSSKEIEKFPKNFYEKIEFYKTDSYPDILRLKKI